MGVPSWWQSLPSLALLCLSCGGSPRGPIIPSQDLQTLDLRPPAPKNAAFPTLRLPAGTVADNLFGELVIDRFRWLEDPNDPATQAWMNDHDLASRQFLGQLPNKDSLERRLTELYYLDVRSVPIVRGERLFFSRKPADKEKAIHFWQQGESGTPVVLLDPNTMSPDGSLSIKQVVPSKDGRLVAYLESPNNADESTLKVMQVDSGTVSQRDIIHGLRYTSPSWTADGTGFFYTWLPTDPDIPSNERSAYAEIRYHALGTDPAGDLLIREKTGDASRWQGAWLSEDGDYLFLSVGRGWSQNDLYVKRLAQVGISGAFEPLATGLEARFEAFAFADNLYVLTNQGAPNYKLYRVAPAQLDRAHWQEVIAERPDAVLEDVSVIGGALAVRYLKNAHTELALHVLTGDKLHDLTLPSLGTASSLTGNEDKDSAYFAFSSYTHPSEIYRVSVRSGRSQRFFRVDAPVDPSRFQLEQVFFSSKDGTQVSMFIVRAKNLQRDGKRPTLLYGYGGFNVSLTPRFDADLFPWLEAGGVYAVPNLRGGGEYGEAWHKAGMLGAKQNVFDDFTAAAQWLIDHGYTSPEHLAIMGKSNGGLLVGAAMTQQPQLFRTVVCGVPLLDMLRYHHVGIGKAWVPEYGDPQVEEHFRWLRAYSPYHRLDPDTRYPALLMLSADSDDRVDPMHARKFVARLEELRTPQDPVTLIRIERNAGHGGGDLRKKALAESVDVLAFLLDQTKQTDKLAPEKSTVTPEVEPAEPQGAATDPQSPTGAAPTE